MDENRKIRTDIFEYDKGFSAFKSSTTQNKDGTVIIQTLINKLKDAGCVGCGHHPLVVGDVCCGAAEVTIDYLRNVDFLPGFDIRGIDANPQYTGYQGNQLITNDSDLDIYQSLESQMDGLAVINLAKAKQSQTIPLKHYQIGHGDVLNDDLTQLLLTKDELRQKTQPFRLIFLSHGAYYFINSNQQNRQQFIKLIGKMNSDLLAQDGIIILLHSTLLPNSYTVMGAKFASNNIKDNYIPTAEEYNQFSCDAVIRTACQQFGLKCFEISYSSKLHFSQYLFEYADIFKDPSRYDELLCNEEALQDLHRMLFITHRSPQNLYQDTSSRGLTSLVDQTVDMVRSYGHLNSYIAIQIIPSKKASPEFLQRLQAIVNDINNSRLAG